MDPEIEGGSFCTTQPSLREARWSQTALASVAEGRQHGNCSLAVEVSLLPENVCSHSIGPSQSRGLYDFKEVQTGTAMCMEGKYQAYWGTA